MGHRPFTHDRERIAEKIRRHRALDMDMYGRVWIRRAPPQPGATARFFGAGPGREDGGGWAAVLVRNVFECLAVSEYEFAQRVGTSPSEVERLISGAGARPSAKDVEQLLARLGVPMAIRIEEYCDDDDYEHELWVADPAAYEAKIAAIPLRTARKDPIVQDETHLALGRIAEHLKRHRVKFVVIGGWVD